MESKKINQLATEMAPATSDLTIIGDPITGVSKKITLLQIADLFATTGTVTSVAVTETGDALTITGSPITSAGTINIGFSGDATQYVRGDGALADFPTSTGGGSSVSYYLNSSVSQGTIGGVAYRELSKDPISGAGTDITISADGYVASYITDANDPALLEVPGGNFNCEFYFSVNSNNHNPYVYAELYKYDGTTFTLLGSSQSVPEYLSNGTTLSPYYFAIPVATAVLSVTDRLAIRIYVNVDGRVVTLHTENNHLCQVVTTFSKGLTSLNNLTRQVQFLATGTSGTDFAITSSTATHTFNLPVASATNTGKLSSTDWSTFNGKYNLPSLTSGSVLFSNGTTIAQNNANFFWDNTNSFLGVGTNVPSAGVTSFSATAATQFKAAGTAPAITFSNTLTSASLACVFGLATSNNHFIFGTAAGDMAIANQSTSAGAIVFGTGTTEKMRMTSAGTFSIGNTNSTFNLDVTGTGRFTGVLTLGSTISNGTYTYTLPSATGTLALTSDLSAYVTLATTQTITGDKVYSGVNTFDTYQTRFTAGIAINQTLSGGAVGSHTVIGANVNGLNVNFPAGGYNSLNFASTSVGNTYTFPNATGTLALTSDLSAYLPLAGGTLTGALSGTSATFSGNIAIGTNPASAAAGAVLRLPFDNAIRWRNSSNTADVGFYLGTSNLFQFDSGINVGGAATFSSSVTVGTALASGTALAISNTTNARQFQFGYSTGAGYNYFQVYDGTSFQALVLNNALTLASTGAATFSSSVTAGVITSSVASGTGTLKINNSSVSKAWSFYPTTNGSQTDITLYEEGTGLNIMTFKSGGNVGIGTSSPQNSLVVSNAGAEGVEIYANSNGGNIFAYNRSTSAYKNLLLAAGGGNVLIGTTSNIEGKLQVSQSGDVWNTEILHSFSTQYFMVFRYNGTAIGSIIGNGTTTAYNTTSDYRLKEDLKEYSGLDLISKIKTYDYQWKSDKSRMYGVIAHELQEVIPYAVVGKKDDLEKNGTIKAQGVDYSKLVPLLVKSIQELEARIKQLENK